MRTTRLAAAGAAAAIALGGAVAAADNHTDTQTVTINVEALARTVTTGGSATLTITAGAAGTTAVPTGEPTIAYTNGPDGAAKITAALTEVNGSATGMATAWRNGLGDLELAISLAAAADGRDETTAAGAAIKEFSGLLTSNAGNLLTGIPVNVERSATAVAYTLAGTAPSAAASTDLTITFTIAADDTDD
jgi:hypothetical protein